jgi:TPR repeat protein
MSDIIFGGVNLNELAAKDPFMAEYLADTLSDADYSGLPLDGLTAEEIHQIGKDYRDATHYKKTDLELAKKYLQAAADKGLVAAWADLGLMYYTDMIPNYEKALHWWKRAADAGHDGAMFAIGEMYEYAYGVTQNMAEAFRWYQAAADAGNGEAWCALANKAYFGLEEFFAGQEQYIRAFECYKKGAELGNNNSMYGLARMYRTGEGTVGNMYQAVEWLEKAVDAGNGIALETLRVMYENGEVPDPKYNTAAEWLSAVPYGAEAAINLAYTYRSIDSENPPPLSDYKKAVYWYEQAAAKGSVPAMNELIELYTRGGKHGEKSTLPIDMKKAAQWVIRAAETGDAGAMYTYSLWLDPPDGMPCGGVPRDQAKSFEWLKKAAIAGSANAMYQMGERYIHDDYYGNSLVKKDLKLAREWYIKAREHGNDIADISVRLIDKELQGE